MLSDAQKSEHLGAALGGMADAVLEQRTLRRREVRSRIVDALAAPRARARVPFFRAAVALAAVAAAIAFAVRPRTERLTVRVDDALVEAREFVRAPLGAPARISFSDGTLIDVAPSGLARIGAVAAHGADVVLESG